MKVRRDQIFDIKTRASYKPFDMNEILPRLWVNQTSKFLIAYHQSGLFDKPEVKDVRQEIMRWENGNAALLARFHALVKRIVDVVRDSDQRQCKVSWDGQGLYVSQSRSEKGGGRFHLIFCTSWKFRISQAAPVPSYTRTAHPNSSQNQSISLQLDGDLSPVGLIGCHGRTDADLSNERGFPSSPSNSHRWLRTIAISLSCRTASDQASVLQFNKCAFEIYS